MASTPKKTKGRQKVALVRMEKDSNRQVTFSKRRLGLFKKASELCTLCGAEAAIVVFSPGKKAFSFGHPSVDSVIDRFLFSGGPPPSSSGGSSGRVEAEHAAQSRDLSLKLTAISTRLDMEKRRGEEISNMGRAGGERLVDWKEAIEELNLENLKFLKANLEKLKNVVIEHGNRLMMMKASARANNSNPAPFVNPGNGVGYPQGYY